MKTKYRIISDGCWWYVQYYKEVTKKFLFWEFDRSYWSYIRYPYYSKTSGDYFGFASEKVASTHSYGYNKEYLLKYFKENYPYIDKYFIWYHKRQNELIEISNQWSRENMSRKDKTIY